MLLIELTEFFIGLAVAAIFIVCFVVAIQVFFWLLFAFLIVAAIGILLFNFPIHFFVVIAIVVLAVMGLFNIIMSIGRSVRRKFFGSPPSSELRS